MLFDTHCHLDMDEFADTLPATIANAREAGVVGAICVASTSDTYSKTLQIVSGHDEFWAAYGLSPFEADLWPDNERLLRQYLAGEKAVAVGECGIDNYHDIFTPQLQLECFRGQLQLAGQLGLPVIIHCRDAWGEVRREVDLAVRDFPGLNGVLHCFTGTPNDALFFVSRGFYVSFAGNLTYPKSVAIQETLKAIDLDFVLFETDAPYLSPNPYRGRLNEPAHVRSTVEFGAELLGMGFAELAEHSVRNAKRLFRRIK